MVLVPPLGSGWLRKGCQESWLCDVHIHFLLLHLGFETPMRTEEERGRETKGQEGGTGRGGGGERRRAGGRGRERENIKTFTSICFLGSEFYHRDETHLV